MAYPEDAQKSNSRKFERGTKEANGLSVEQKKEYRGITDLYKIPGSAADVLASLADDEFSYDMFSSQLGFHRGEYNIAISLALKYADDNETDIIRRIAVGIQLMLGAIYIGDIRPWRRGYDYMSKTVCHDQREEGALAFWLGVGPSAVTNKPSYPEWFKRGDFTRLSPDTFAMASYSYVKYLYSLLGTEQSVNDRTSVIEKLRTMPRIIEPLISRVCFDRVIIIEIYLRLLCALAYHIIGKDEYAVSHLERAIALALPDKLYSPLAEYRRRFGFLMDDRITLQSSTALAEIKALSKSFIDGWTALHNEVTGRSVSATLSTREWQTARLATYGLSNKEIADRMGVSVNAVKQALRMLMDKTGAETRSEIGKYI